MNVRRRKLLLFSKGHGTSSALNLSQAVVFLYTRSDGHEVRRALQEAATEEEAGNVPLLPFIAELGRWEVERTCDLQITDRTALQYNGL